MNVNPGELNKSIVIKKITYPIDADGIATKTYTTIRTTKASFTRTSGTELQKSGTEFADVKARFLVRRTPIKLDTSMIVAYDSNEYNIAYVNEYKDSKEYVEIWCDLKEME